jgi:hypothetical protein
VNKGSASGKADTRQSSKQRMAEGRGRPKKSKLMNLGLYKFYARADLGICKKGGTGRVFQGKQRRSLKRKVIGLG